ncbi:aminotransferase class I/II-fold pyridoxal phosphate-dependent enzyme [Caldicoprobacter algeriensis]|uniref:trans-sulfuration enzyme family protein n=1 Tax=Caldicoprobacter algeriensis TaxID=699281 RepID=UPI002079C9B0|nr:aminotransferase class I/II-fold pyridoxal phosphate-dependent enzyme [Caldicoprobacter algeriensis]MCM8901564.1 aminotransferase class I/II-fold pyridoxal phosphate-dependent enzyme [Caldicoprobacter algeriensis]
MRFATKLIHNGNEMDKNTGALSIPIYQVSTYHLRDIDQPQEYEYSRSGNPTRKALEETIAILEGGDKGFAFASGMAAIASVLSIFSSGDHIIVSQDVYGGTHRILTSFFARYHLSASFVDTTDIDAVKKSITPNTRAIYVETPSNPLLKITDLRSIVKIAREHNLITIIDNTFMSPYLQRPIELGFDIVIHSATKFIGGHSDVIGGLVVVKGAELSQRIYSVQNGFGAILGPQDSWLLLRGLKTLKVRLDYQQDSAQKLAEYLQKNKNVKQVYYPGLQNHEGRDIHYSQADGAGAVLSFKTIDAEKAKSFMKKIKLAAVAASLGGIETIVSYPSKMSHAAVPRSERERLGITDDLIRVSVGLEDIEDLIEDFEKALY